MSDYNLSGRAAIITGASRGLGLVIAKTFFQAGADLLICSRNSQAIARASREIQELRRSDSQRLISVAADVSNPDDVGRLAEITLREIPALTILVNNAGVYGPMGSIETVGWEEWKAALEINLYGQVLMCRAFLPHFRQRHYGKIIQISGGGATNPMPRLESYAAGKAAVVRFMESLALDCRRDGIDVNSVAPGLLDTQLLDQVLEAGPEAVGEDFYQRMLTAKKQGQSTPLDIGAKLCLFLASSASDGLTGRLISAVWDNYEDWPNHLDELKASDIYTLRRITGRDRGQSWGDK
jgi:3-oxoacyl-[acyl-carrier protein] reductase